MKKIMFLSILLMTGACSLYSHALDESIAQLHNVRYEDLFDDSDEEGDEDYGDYFLRVIIPVNPSAAPVFIIETREGAASSQQDLQEMEIQEIGR